MRIITATRKVGPYVDIQIQVNGVSHELGLHDETELKTLHEELRSATAQVAGYLPEVKEEEEE